MKLIDFESLFDKKLAQYMKENAGKYTEEQWEKLIPKLYQSYGDTFIKAAGATPRAYFAGMSDAELCLYLKECVKENLSVSDFLLREIEKRDCPKELCALLEGAEEALSLVILDAAGESDRAGELFFSVLVGDAPASVKDAAAEKLKRFSMQPFLDRAIECYRKSLGREYLLELFSSCGLSDDRILEIFLEELKKADENLPVIAGLVARYGDERALDVLLELIDREETGFVAFRELLCAIEALGGHYEKKRDFSSDKDFLRVKEHSEKDCL